MYRKTLNGAPLSVPDNASEYLHGDEGLASSRTAAQSRLSALAGGRPTEHPESLEELAMQRVQEVRSRSTFPRVSVFLLYDDSRSEHVEANAEVAIQITLCTGSRIQRYFGREDVRSNREVLRWAGHEAASSSAALRKHERA